MKERAVEKLARKYPNLADILKDSGKKAALFLGISLCATLLFAVYNAVLAVIYKAEWNIVLGGYYFLLLVSKIGLLFGFKNSRRNEDKAEFHGALTYLISGIVLFILHTPLVILVIALKEQSFHYEGLLIYVYAAYAFYKIIAAIVHFVRSYKNRSGMVMQAIRNINLADAMVSVLALQTALISSFGDLPYANIITGSVICGLVMICSIFMILRSSIELAKMRRKSNG